MTTRMITIAVAAAATAAASPLANQRRAAAPVISSCTAPNTVAITFDDGPYQFTDSVLDQFEAAGMKATFFLNGQNWGNIYEYAGTVERMYAAGHQIGSHTWSHPHMPDLDEAGTKEEMTKVEDALLDIIGKFPTYMRPPFFEWDAENLDVLGELGYKVMWADLDTQDWQGNMDDSISIFESGIQNGGSLVLAHDVHETTAEVLVPAMISAIQEAGLTAVTVGECLGDPESNWYRTSRDDSEPEPEPSEEPTPTPSEPTEPSATPTDGTEPSATPTDGTEPSATPTDGTEPSATPTDGTEPSATPTDGTDPSATPTDGTEPSATPTDGTEPSATPTDDGTYPEPTGDSDPSATPTDDGTYPEPTDGSDPSVTPSPTDDGTYPEPTTTKTPGKGCRAKRSKRNAKAKKAKRSAKN